MIFYRKNDEIDRDLWDDCIKKSSCFKPYAYSWYLDIMTPGWQALIDDNYESVFPLPVHNRFGINYIATPIFLQQLGIFSTSKSETNQSNEFLGSIPDKFKLIDLCIGNIPDDAPGFKLTEKDNFELDLSLTYEELGHSFTSDCRRNIQISEKNKIELTSEISPEELVDLFILNTGESLEGIKTHDYARLQHLMNYCISSAKGKIIGVRVAGKKLISGVFLIQVPGSVTILFTANTTESRKLRTGYFVINEIIKEYASSSTRLDFSGSSIPSIASFMKSFGSLNVPYYRLFRNRLPWPVRFLKQ